MGFVFPQAVPIQPGNPGQTVCLAAAFQFVQSGNLRFVQRDDNLATLFVRHPIFGAEAVQKFPAFGAGAGLLAAGLVIQPRVDDATVVARLVSGDTVFGLQHRDAGATGLRHEEGGGQAHNTATNDRHLGALSHGRCHSGLVGSQARARSVFSRTEGASRSAARRISLAASVRLSAVPRKPVRPGRMLRSSSAP